MTSLFPSQRAAEDFDSVVEGRAPSAVVDRYAPRSDRAREAARALESAA